MLLDLGKIGITIDSDEWSSSKSYEILTILRYKGQGFLSLKDNLAVEPGTDESVWMLVAIKGDNGRDFTFADFTKEQLDMLMKPALDAAATANAAAAAASEETAAVAGVSSDARKALDVANTLVEELQVIRDDLNLFKENIDTFNKDVAKEEKSRQINEKTRDENENKRKSNEKERQKSFSEALVKSENSTAAADEAVAKISEALVESESSTAAANEAVASIDSKINPVIDSDAKQNQKISDLERSISDLQNFHDTDFCVSMYDDGQLAPEALDTKGSKSYALAWFPWLVDMTDNAGPAVTRARVLKRNNWFRYAAMGTFAPAVCISAEDWGLCDAELYLDAGHTQKYCEAGAFNAESFYKDHGVNTPLYTVDGTKIKHIRRPWETTNKDLSRFLARKDTVRICDNLTGRSGKVMKGVFGSQTNYDGAHFDQFILPPTGISPSPVCTIENKTRCFFYLMPGETNCQGGKGAGDISSIFPQDRTYPRAGDMHQVNDMKWSRANNANPDSPMPFSEGGYFALNAFLTCMEVGYGTKYLNDPETFSSGISSNESCSSENTWKKYGGVRYKRAESSDWKYGYWAATTEICYNSSGKKGNFSETINNYWPKTQVNEAQIAASYAVELGIPAGQQFELYGGTYWWEEVPGAVSLTDGEMNARIYKIMSGKINGFLEDGTPQEWDAEVILRIGLIQGMDSSGDVFAYWGGGYEQVGTVETPEQDQGGYGSNIDLYLETDQTKWMNVTNATIKIGEKFPFENQYLYLGRAVNERSYYALKRNPYSAYPKIFGGSRNAGECFYSYLNNWFTSIKNRARIAARLRGYSHYASCAPRHLYANNSVLNTYRYYAGSAQVLIDAVECNALQAQSERSEAHNNSSVTHLVIIPA